ncbi:uncharacterized protein C8R40DRAFT_1177787 [Lentinula edodes]|uniref:uncharacterized protein n=1 Tax=Lentinula edodes TaxID=5353 RepID=UPI001E8EE51C|nr:uncharacterized protein C8R40DRAFT_1177787 [Lentinula edodes]KAH7868433.1 hypothetical protein C8R40DRAFT_1177787 [Lentinula edodes]
MVRMTTGRKAPPLPRKRVGETLSAPLDEAATVRANIKHRKNGHTKQEPRRKKHQTKRPDCHHDGTSAKM